MENSRAFRAIIVLLFVILVPVGGPSLRGQVATGTISGTVTDETGAILPGVGVSLTRVETGQVRQAVTTDEGYFKAPQLPVGEYEVRAEFPGFQTAVRRGIELLVGQEAVLTLRMNIGELSEEVVVTGEAPLVNTTTATLGEVISEQQVHDLPLNSRNLSQLSLLTPGVVQLRTATTGGVTQGPSSVRVSVGGARIYQTGYLLDGVDVTDSSRGMSPGGAAGSLFGVETVKEFQVITNNYSAEYSRFSGGIMSMVTKSGTNKLHGSLFWFHHNDNLDATDFFTNKAGLEKDEFRRHQFGATVGGPIVQDRTFYFFSYEGFRQALGQTLTNLVPSRDVRQGLFPLVSGGCAAYAAQGGAPTADGSKCQLPLHPSIGPFLALYPLPNGPEQGNTGDLIVSQTEPTEEDFFTGRVDHAFSESDSFLARYTQSDGGRSPVVSGQGSIIPFTLTDLTNLNIYSTLEWKHIFSPSSINTARFGAQRNEWKEAPSNPGPLDIGFFPARAMGDIVPGEGVAHGGLRVEGQNISNQFSYADDLFLNRGRHDLKLGVLITRYQTNDFTIGRGGGSFTFSSLADFVTGRPFEWRGKIPADRSQRGSRQTVMGFYVQDDYRWARNLSLNLGLRYEPTTTPSEVNGLMANLRNPLIDSEAFIGEPFFKNPSWTNFAPRIGVAWDPFGTGRTSVRAGYGLFHDAILPYLYSGQIRRSPPLALEPVLRDAASLRAQFPRPPAEAVDAVGGTLEFNIAEFDPAQPYAQQWNLSLQQEAFHGITLSAAYVGSRGTHLQVQRNLNARVPEILGDGRKLFRTSTPSRNPAWGDLEFWEFSSNSFYHGLQLGGRKRFSGGLQFQAAYTLGRSVDSASSVNQSDIQENTSKVPGDQYNVAGSNQGLSDHDVRHNFSFNYVYELPRLGWSGWAGRALNGWQLNGILQLSTGNPYDLNTGSGRNLTDYDRDGETSAGGPMLIAGRHNNPVLEDGRNPDRYYDPTSFTLPDPGFYGDVGRNTLIGPGVSTFDVSLFKNTYLREGVNLQFRAEFFNAFNRSNFGAPDRSVFSAADITSVPCSTHGSTGGASGCSQLTGVTYRPTAGRITRSRTTGREIQFGLRLVF